MELNIHKLNWKKFELKQRKYRKNHGSGQQIRANLIVLPLKNE